MQNPLTNFPEVTELTFEPDSALIYPELSALVLKTISATARIELERGNILCSLLEDNSGARTAFYMFSEINNTAIQSKALLRAAEQNLSEDEFRILKKIERVKESTASVRNSFAHSVWASSQQLPNALLRLPHNLADHEPLFYPERRGVLLGPAPDKIEVFFEVDLSTIASTAWNMVEKYSKFSQYLFLKYNSVEPLSAHGMLDDFAERFARQRETQIANLLQEFQEL